jgi:hypothetical protein
MHTSTCRSSSQKLQEAAHAQESEHATTENLSAESKRLKADIDQAQGLAAAFMEVCFLTLSSVVQVDCN